MSRNRSFYRCAICRAVPFVLFLFAAAPIAGAASIPQAEQSSSIDDANQVEDGALSFRMNRGAIFTENETIAAALGAALSELIDTIHRGEIEERHIAQDDQERHAFFISALRRLKIDPNAPGAAPLVLKSFSPDGDKSFLISVAFLRSQDGVDQIGKIVEFHAYPHEGGYRFRCPFDYRTRNLDTLDVGDVRYRFTGSLNRAKADEFVGFKRRFESLLEKPTTRLTYYRFETLDELLSAHGVVYDSGKCNWLKEDLGFMDDGGRRFITGTGNERFIFDYVVDYMSHFCDDAGDLYPPFVYGMAAYYGGYGLSGDDLETLKAQFRAERAARPEIDFLAEYRKGRKSSIKRHFTYFVIGAFLCEEALERRGFDTVMELARSGRSGERFFETLEERLGVTENNFHESIVRMIGEEEPADASS